MSNYKGLLFKSFIFASICISFLATRLPAIQPYQLHASDKSTTNYNIAGKNIKLVVPNNQCSLTDKNPSDKKVLDGIRIGVRGQTELMNSFATCQELKNWRRGTRTFLDNFGNYQTPIKTQGQDFTGQESLIIKSVCDVYKKQGESLFDGLKADIDKRIEEGFANIKLNQNKMIGVIKETNDICVIAVAQRLKSEANTFKDQINVFSVSVLKGRIIFTYLFAPTKVNDVVSKLTKEIIAINKSNQELNK